ncbi:MAG: kinase/pyrophosphorylase, partial [Actinomycetia bacterium]|nr:kinase/pyrophosphorylase [Actinomycetes bacterium]
QISKKKRVVDKDSVLEVLKEIKDSADLIVFTFVNKDLSKLIKSETKKEGIPSIDILGPILSAFESITGKKPHYQPGVWRELNRDYFKKVDALEYSVRHDDGKNPEGLKEADIVIIGVSRSSKTPISIYLANKGIKAANVPVIVGIELPREIYDIPRRKIVGLTISPTRLLRLRQKRLLLLKIKRNNYAVLDIVAKEIAFAERIFRKLGCPKIDITQKAIEETADEIIKIISREG